MKRPILVAAVTLAITALALNASGRMAPEAYQDKDDWSNLSTVGVPLHCMAGHHINRLALTVNNNGCLGNQYGVGPNLDWFTGEEIPSCEYPSGSNSDYLYGGSFWIGAVVGRDTLVSVGNGGWTPINEFYPDEAPFGEMIKRSILDPSAEEFEDAISEEDYIAVYTDTFTDGVPPDPITGRPHTPLNIEVTQASYAWSYEYAEDFVLFDFNIRNIGSRTLEEVFMGVYIDADVGYGNINNWPGQGGPAQDDICGFLPTYTFTYGNCDFNDEVFIAWIADNDGELQPNNNGVVQPAPNVTATRIVRTPSDELNVSFNWWIGNVVTDLDFGPRERPFTGRLEEDFRTFANRNLGTPESNADMYYQLQNREFDYDQIFTASIQPNDTLWMYPPQSDARNWSAGMDTRYLLSFGPFTISSGQTLPLSFAYVGGEGFHNDADNWDNYLGQLVYDPEAFYSNLDFSDLALNATWASWVYDNPGVDTDSDGYYGKFHLCDAEDSTIDRIDTITTIPLETDTIWAYLGADTFWYEGDDVPDFRGASPPPAPEFWVTPSVGALHLRINGTRSETTADVFSREVDFEGYRIYLARDDRPASFQLIESYDREDYNRLVYDPAARPPDYILLETPFTIEELRCLYGDSCNDMTFDPLSYTRANPYVIENDPPVPDEIFYFEPQDYNQIDTKIRKRFPDQPYPTSINPDSAQPEELTPDGYLKYFEYEFEIEDLLPSVPYWINVTAFDFGSPESGLASLETPPSRGAKVAFPQNSWDEIQNQNLKAYVYPNPYRIDEDYRAAGFEGRGEEDRPPDRTRTVMFANIPPKCVIRIYSLDGDLVREIEHDADVYEFETQHRWDLITRNTQMVVSGLYYWTIESEDGETQVGKLAIIM